ncbi:MAG: DUF4450 domain-containing protein [Prevotella sp.]|nr:DUF4450 domain-containing protein [Prevotella sp.]
MNTKNFSRLFATFLLTLAAVSVMAATGRKQQYYPEGRDIVCQDGDKRYNRALYGSYTEYRLETSDRPIFAVYRSKAHKNIRFRLTANGKTTLLEQTTHAEARYNAGKRVYKLTDTSWGKGSLTITVLLQPDAESAIWKFEPQSMPADAKVEMVVCDIKRPKFNRSGDMNSDPADSFEPADGEPNKQTIQWSLGTETTYAVLDCKGGAYRNANPQATYTVLDSGASTYTLSTPTGAEAERLYAKAWKHHEWLAGNIVFDTPDPYLNTMGGTLMAAADGAWDGEVWLHGAIVWRMQLNGWRAGFLGDLLGLPDRAVSHFNAYANSQITDVEPVIPNPTPDPEKLLTREAKTWGTQMYSNGYICRYPNRKDIMHHYDMNLNYIDELLLHLEYDANKDYLRKMWPVIKLHLEWEKRNFDPDDDGLYDAYCCIWASDALYYNGGAVSHSTAYNYRTFRLAARICEIIGEDPTYYKKEADKTLKAMNERLWLKDRGHWAEYQDLMGLKRKHEHAALWSIYTPIDCGMATPEQAIRATQYVDSCIPHIPVIIEGVKTSKKEKPLFQISTTDWLPYDWSINNVAAEETMHMALAYFQAGRSEEGFRLIKANIMDQAYLGGSPGNFGQISYYDRARGELYRDFSDNVGISARAFIEGLYGIRPDALNGRCYIRPGFPAEWKHASIETPYMKYTFRQEGNKEIYEIEQNFAQPLQIVLRQNTGVGYVETIGTTEKKQIITVTRAKQQPLPRPLITAEHIDGKAWGNNFDDVKTDRLETVDMDAKWNSNVADIFKNFYLSPRPKVTTLTIPAHGIGEWCHPEFMANINDAALRRQVKDGVYQTELGIPFRTPAKGRNIAYTSLWDNYPDAVTIPLQGKASHAYLLMAGSTNHMQSRIENGQIVVTYTDGSTDTLPLYNPHNWCPIEQDYYEDGLQFHAAQPRPYRLDFVSLKVSREHMAMGERYGYQQRDFKGGAGVLLDMPLNPRKQLRDITVRTLSNDVVIGLMGITLQR